MKNTNLEKTTFCNRHKNAQTDRSNHDIDVSPLPHEPQTHVQSRRKGPYERQSRISTEPHMVKLAFKN